MGVIRRTGRLALASVVVGALALGCGSETPEAPPAAASDYERALVLSLSVFPVGADGKASTRPGPATLVILTRRAGVWVHETLEDPDSNVFHKAVAYAPPGERPGILTIAGDAARLKLWRKQGGRWQAQTLWGPSFGGKRDRLRDLELRDLDGDGEPEIVLATHDQGVVAVVHAQPSGVRVEELDRAPRTFVHEIELGDLDRDGALEIYATPSAPNKLDGRPQSGTVKRYAAGGAKGGVDFVDLGDRHAKEILVTDLDGDGQDELYVAVEGRVSTGRRVESVEIRRYTADSSVGEVIAHFDDHLCRVLVPADVDGDGVRELVVAPFKAGLWLLRPAEGEWTQLLIDADSSGFEHATNAFDLDADRRDEIYTAADDQGAVRRYVWNGRGFDREEIFRTPDALKGFTWNVNAVPVELTR